ADRQPMVPLQGARGVRARARAQPPRRIPGPAVRPPGPGRAGQPRLHAERGGDRARRAHRRRVQGCRGARRGGDPGRRPDGRLSGRVPGAGAARLRAPVSARGAQKLKVALPLAATLAIQTLVSTAMYCAPVIAPAAAPLLGVAPAEIGYFVTAAYLGSMIGTATAGGWVERFGPIRVSQAGMLLCGCGLAIAASGSLPAVLVGAL